MGGRPGGPGGGPGFGPPGPVFDAAGQALGLGPAELRDRLRQGKTLTQVAQELGKDPAAVQGALQAALQARLDQAVAAGRVPAERVDAMKARLGQMAERLMNAPLRGQRGGQPDDGRRGPRGPRQPAPVQSGTP
jgi:hypothetical protein